MQGRTDQAIAKYREAIGHPRTHDTYDRARLDAYDHLLAILRQRGDIDAMEALHKQRTQEFGPHNCYAAEYALFLVQDRGTPIPAIELAKQALDAPCGAEAARQVLGIAYYSAWAGAAEGQRNELLNQARAFLPAGPYQMYVLSTNERTATVVRQLLAGGESIDQRDNRRMNALAYALQHQDLGAARRLLRSGAHPDAPVGEGDMPVALLPVISSDFEGIRLMQQFGVDYAKLRYQGTTALDRARQMGDRRLIDALDRKANSL